MSLPLYIDDRAGSRDLLDYPCVADIAEITRMEFGDAMIVGNGPEDTTVSVGVEVKSVHDLISSINTGRLQATQLPGLLRDYEQPWLLWFGSVRAGADGRLEIRHRKRAGGSRRSADGQWKTFRLGNRDVPYAYLASQLFDISTTGVRVAHVYDEAEAAVWLYCLHRWWSKPWHHHKGLRVLDSSRDVSLMPSMDDHTRLKVCVAKQLPGVGFDRAMSAAGHFKSVVDMVVAPTQEWEKVPGIGRVVAKSVVDAVRRQD